MRTIASFGAIGAALSVLVSAGHAAPALGEKPTKWEYAELKIMRTLVPNPPGLGDGGVFKTSLLWSTEEGETEGEDWKDLAIKLKAPPLKAKAAATLEKLRLLNRLGADGWELVDHKEKPNEKVGLQRSVELETWLFKRSVR